VCVRESARELESERARERECVREIECNGDGTQFEVSITRAIFFGQLVCVCVCVRMFACV